MFFNYLYCLVCFGFHFKIVMSFSLPKESQVENKENSDFTSVKESNVDEINSAAQVQHSAAQVQHSAAQVQHSAANNNNTKIRAKRQSGGAGKFTDAAKMPQVKIMRLFTQLFKNFWAAAYVGGAHPFHHEIPKVVVTLYKQKILEFFFPDVGEDPDKSMS